VDNVVLLGEQVIGPVRHSVSSGPCASQHALFCQSVHPMHPRNAPDIQSQGSSSDPAGCSVPEAELPVAGGVDVPVGEGLDPALQPWALHNGGGEGRRGHDCGVRRACAGGRGAACRQWSGEGQISESLSSIFARPNWLRGLSFDPRAWQARLAAPHSNLRYKHAHSVTSLRAPTSTPEPLHCVQLASALPYTVRPSALDPVYSHPPQRRMSMELSIR
jgi:hypothetical protein